MTKDYHIVTLKLQYDFYQKDLNWFYKPQNYIIDNFVKRDYDILINLCDSSCIPIKYLVAKSIARFKIGMYEENFDIYDLMIELKKEINSKAYGRNQALH